MSDPAEKQKVVLPCLLMAKPGTEGRDVQAKMSGVCHAFQTAIVDMSIFQHAGEWVAEMMSLERELGLKVGKHYCYLLR